MDLSSPRIIDITLPVRNDMVTYPGDTCFQASPVCTILRSGCNMTELTLGTHTGTHIDAPRHFFAHGKGIDDFPPEKFIGPARVVWIDAPAVTESVIQDLPLDGIRHLLFKSRNSPLLRSREFSKVFTHLTPEAAQGLVHRGLDTVGIDYLSIEQFGTPDFAVHKLLLKHDICILEGLDLADVSPGLYYLIAIPLRIPEGDGSPVRAVLVKN